MAYATAVKIRRRLQALPAEAVDEALDADLESAIEDADAKCNLYLAKAGYAIPVTGGADAVKAIINISSTLAAAYIVRDNFSGGGENQAPGLYKTLYDEAMADLEAIAEKDVLLPVEETPDVEELPEAAAVYGTHSALGQRSNIRDAPFWKEFPESYYNTGTTGYR